MQSRFVLYLDGLPLGLQAAPGWLPLTWESVLAAYARSDHEWVRTTASAWLDALDSLVPHVDSDTVWNDVPADAAGFELALRVRMVWLARRMDEWCHLDHDLALSSGGGAWVAAMRAQATSSGHRVIAEMQEGLAAQSWRHDSARPYRSRLTGPVVLVGLSQAGVSTSAGFDWSLLHRLFSQRIVDSSGHIMDGRDWQTTSANPRDPTDRANWQAMVAAGAPKWLGKGYGMATARTHKVAPSVPACSLTPSSPSARSTHNYRRSRRS